MTPFKVGDKVKIDGLESPGKIIGVWSDENGGVNYNVRYADTDDRLHSIWVGGPSLTKV